jgi:uncharacterized membrane protein YphA (DoxX/SURF4 family)
MKVLLQNDHLSLLARAFVGGLFVVISIDKIADPASFATSIGNYRLLPQWSLEVIATILPWLELLCGLSLLAGLFVRGSALLLTGMLFIFTVAIVTALLRGLDITCGCFTQDPSAEKIGWMKVAENVSLFLLILFVFLAKNARFTVVSYLQHTAGGRPS